MFQNLEFKGFADFRGNQKQHITGSDTIGNMNGNTTSEAMNKACLKGKFSELSFKS